ncbi:MAG: AmmeMemoRadiSam system protein B [Sandaracinaceae bacterium]
MSDLARPEIRRAELAGTWYPGEPGACRAAIDRHRAGATPGSERALIGPHAGWTYSGTCAGLGYASLDPATRSAELAIVFGSHRGPAGPDTVFTAEGWDTPLGVLETDRELAARAAEELGIVSEPVAPQRADNAVEVHLPFVRHAFPRARLLMLGVAAAPHARAIGAAVGALAKDRDAVVIGSTDLTHYGPNYGWAPHGGGEPAVRWVREVNDAGFVSRVTSDDPDAALRHAIDEQSACCPGAVIAAMEAARVLSGAIAPRLIDHRLSTDVRPSESFVGYASIVM